MYDLKSVSDDYETFLTSIGIPSFAVFFILRGSETLEMEILPDGSVKSKTITGDVNLDYVIDTNPGSRSRLAVSSSDLKLKQNEFDNKKSQFSV